MIIAIIFFASIALCIISGIIAAIWAFISTKFWKSFTIDEDWYDNDENNDDDLLEEAWVRSAISKEKNRKGFYFTYLLDTNKKWYKIWNFQWKQRVKIQILKWRTRRKLWK
jgi:hypothetical protein